MREGVVVSDFTAISFFGQPMAGEPESLQRLEVLGRRRRVAAALPPLDSFREPHQTTLTNPKRGSVPILLPPSLSFPLSICSAQYCEKTCLLPNLPISQFLSTLSRSSAQNHTC